MSTLFLGFGIYFLIWWLVWFAVLPWGVQRQDSPEAGHDPGAPVRPMIAIKFLATTLVSAAILGAGYALWVSGIVSLDMLPMPFEMPRR
jgi:predicted secreted protein